MSLACSWGLVHIEAPNVLFFPFTARKNLSINQLRRQRTVHGNAEQMVVNEKAIKLMCSISDRVFPPK